MSFRSCASCDTEIPAGAAVCSHCGAAAQPTRDAARHFLVRAYSVGCLTVLALLTFMLVYRLATGLL
jgi:predicted nucleic acid-binding Zn ribbon protein